MERYSSIKRNIVLIYATSWMNLKNILSEKSQTQRSQIIGFLLNDISRTGKSIKTEAYKGYQGMWGEGTGE